MNPCVHRILVVMLLGLSAGLIGCGNDHMKTAVVKGTVTYKGRPVSRGTVLFIPKTPGPTATGKLNPDGSYSLTTFKKGDGAVLGKHKVVIAAMESTQGRLPEDRNPLPPPLVPDKYTSAGTSDLEAEVEAKENMKNFDLQGELGRKKR